MASSESSTSGIITSSFENISNVFTGYEEIPSESFNCLYKAQRYGKWFVLKSLKPEFQHKEVYTRLLTKEFELGVKMEHPNIAHTFSKETDPVAGPCIVMEYVDGVTLKEFLAQKPNRKIRMKIAYELLSAMSYYHSLQIVHRDLKPDNILVTRNGHNVKIIDFGLADSDWHGILKQPAGSDKYAAPEQKAGNVPIDCRADLYSFGKILRQLFPLRYRSVVHKCVQEDREKRFSNAEEVLQRMQRHERTMPAVAVLALVIGLAFGAWILIPKSGGQAEDSAQSTKTQEPVALEEAAVDVPVSEEEPVASSLPAELRRTAVAEPAATITANNNRQLPVEVRRSIEQSVDAVFQPFWDWNRAATARGVSPIDKLAEYTQSDFFKNNYEIRERHREAVVSDVLRRYPQCEPIKDSLTMFYNTVFAKRMIAVGEEVYAWEKAAAR